MNSRIGWLLALALACGLITYVVWDRKPQSVDAPELDLTYETILAKNHVKDDEFLPGWLKRTDRTKSKKLLESWNGDPIIEFVLVEHPDFHAGDLSFIWLFRTKQQASLWESYTGREVNKKSLDMKQFEAAFNEISSFRQMKPKSWNQGDEKERKFMSEYMAILNIQHQSGTRQILLSMSDYFEGEEPGRLLKALEPLSK